MFSMRYELSFMHKTMELLFTSLEYDVNSLQYYVKMEDVSSVARNVGNHLHVYTVLQPRISQSDYNITCFHNP